MPVDPILPKGSPGLLLDILTHKDGIFENQDDMPRFGALKKSFNGEIERIRNFSKNDVSGDLPVAPNEMEKITNEIAKIKDISFRINPLPIDQLKENIKALKSNPSLSHLGIFYGLTDTNQMVLIMRGVKLDGSSDGTRLHLKPKIFSANQFTTLNLVPSSSSNIGLLNRFKEVFKFIHGKNKFVWGAYVKLSAFEDKLRQLVETENCTLLQITLGFMKPEPDSTNPLDLNCFQLIFRGLKSDGLTISTKVYSTFDNESGYSGPKPSCPPFGEMDLS